MTNEPVAWWYEGANGREVCWTAEEAEAKRANGIAVHELFGNPWRPISEAPRDGTKVDLWDRGRRLADMSWECHGNLHGERQPESWAPWDRGRLSPDPTHFMLRPKGPNGEVW